MRLRSSLAASSLVLVLFAAACGNDGGGTDTGTDGGNPGVDATQPDAYVPPVANCTALDLAAAPAVTIVTGMVTPNPQGGTVRAGTYKLTSAKLYASGIPVTGTAKARVEIVVGNATSGAARVAVSLDGMALGQVIQQDLTGAGLYTITGTDLAVADGCGGSEPLPVLEYTATDTTLMLWTEYMVTDPITLNIPLELGLAIE